MRISDWSSDVCSSDLGLEVGQHGLVLAVVVAQPVVVVVPGGAEGRFDDVRLAGDIGGRGGLRGSGEVGHQEDGQPESGAHGWDLGRGFPTAGIDSTPSKLATRCKIGRTSCMERYCNNR